MTLALGRSVLGRRFPVEIIHVLLQRSKECSMKRFLTATAVAALVLVVVGAAEAAGKGGGSASKGSGGQSGNFRNFTPTPNSSPTYNKTTSSSPSSYKNSTPAPGASAYLAKHATKYSFGYCYKGYNHCHWTYQCWSPTYGCYTYWCPYACCYYYWCEPHCCYYPVTYCPTGCYAY
jgi:hypothetical protein